MEANSAPQDSVFRTILSEINTTGMSRDLYFRIARTSTRNISQVSIFLIKDVLKHFVAFKDERIYVNEIKNFLRAHDPVLFHEYGKRFNDCNGCYEIFGIEPVNVQPYIHDNNKGEEEVVEEKTFIKKRKNRVKKNIKMEAKAKAVEQYHKKMEKRKIKKQKEEEFQALLRKENGAQ